MQARFDTSGPLTSTLRLTGSDGWFVDRVDLYVGSVDFKCPVSGWLDNGRRAAGPGSRRLTCTSTGEIITLSYNTTPQGGFSTAQEALEDCQEAWAHRASQEVLGDCQEAWAPRAFQEALEKLP